MTVRGCEEIIQKLSAAGQFYHDRINEVMYQEMVNAVAEAQSIAGGRGWMLANDITIIFYSPADMLVIGGCLAEYAGFPEFGTVKQHAQPFWRPAVWSHFFLYYKRAQEIVNEYWSRK